MLLGTKAAETEGLVRDYRFSNGYYDDSYSENAQNKKEEAIDFQLNAFKELQEFQWAHQNWFAKRAQLHEENMKFVLLDEQWTPEDKAAWIARGYKPYVSNILKPFELKMQAEQLGQRNDWRVSGIDQASQDQSELCNHIMRWVEQTTNFHMKASRIIQDARVGGVGMSGTMLDPFDSNGAIKIERYRPQEFMWDVYSARNGALEGVNYFWRGYFQDKKTMSAIFPFWETEILQSASGISPTQLELIHTIIRPEVAAQTGRMEQSSTFDGYLSTLYGKLVFVREFYRRRPLAKWKVYNGYDGSTLLFSSQKEAIAKGRDLLQQYFKQNLDSGGSPNDFIPRISMPEPKTVWVVDRLVFVGDILIDVQTDAEDRIPYQALIPEFIDGSISSFFQHFKDPQRLRNVGAAAIHQVMSGIKATRLINKSKLGSKMTDRQIEEKLIKNGQTWIFNDPTAIDLEGFMKDIPPPQMGTVPETIHRMMSEDINTSGGGLNSIGLSENSGESGRAILQRRSAATSLTAPLLDACRDWQERVGKDVLYLAKFLDPNLLMTISDDMEMPVTKSIISEGIQSIKGFNFNLTVKEVQASPTERDARLERVLALAGQSPDVAQDLMDLVIKYADFDATDRKAYYAARKQREDAIAAQQEHENQMQIQELADKAENNKIQHLVKLKAIQTEAENRAKIMASIKLPATPAIITEVLNSAMPDGDVHPLAVAADVALGDVMELSKLGAQKKQENDLTPAWEKKPAASSNGQSSAKSSAARSNKKK